MSIGTAGVSVRGECGVRHRARRIGTWGRWAAVGICVLACVSLGTNGYGMNSAHASGDAPVNTVHDARPAHGENRHSSENPSPLHFIKEAITTGMVMAGENVSYLFRVENTDSGQLIDVVVKDPKIPSLVCGPFSLAAGEARDCWGTYTVTAADLESKVLSNTATVSATDKTGEKVSAEAKRDTPIKEPSSPVPGIWVNKKAEVDKITAAGQNVPFVFTVTNSGELKLTDVIVSDSMFGPEVAGCGPWTLKPGESRNCKATYRATQEDMDRGVIRSKVTAMGSLDTGEAVKGSSAVDVRTVQRGSLDIMKTSATMAIGQVGQQVTYEFKVTNSGTVTAHDVRVSDPMFGGMMAGCGPWKLAPGQEAACQATYRVTQADIAGGSLTNIATVSGRDPKGNSVPVKSATLTIPGVSQAGGITIVKMAQANDASGRRIEKITAGGDRIVYTFTVRNVGKVTVRDVTVKDHLEVGDPRRLTPVDYRGQSRILKPGEQQTYTATYEVARPDIDAGQVVNVATATGKGVGQDGEGSEMLSLALPSKAVVTAQKTGVVTPPVVKPPYLVVTGGTVIG